MKTFIITAHIEFPTKAGSVLDSGTLRMEVPAESEEEARQKATGFLRSRIKVVVDDCTPKPAEAPKNEARESFEQMMNQFSGLFGKKESEQ